MRLARLRLVGSSATVVLATFIMLLGGTCAFTLTSDDEGRGQAATQLHTQPIHSDVRVSESSSVISSSQPGSSSPPHDSQSSISQPHSAASSRSRSSVLSKRSLSSSSSDPSFPRTHRHENDILNVAWPANAMWGFLPAHKKAPQPGAQHSQSSPMSSSSASSTSSFSKKASSSLSSSSSSALDSALLAKKKSASSDLFLDPVTLDEDQPPASFFSGRQRGGDGSNSNFFHSASSLSGSPPSALSMGGRNGASAAQPVKATPPPRPHYILLQPPTRIEPPLGNDIPPAPVASNDDEMGNEILENEDESSVKSSGEREGDASDHSSWLKRSSSGVVTKSASDVNKRTRSYDVPQIGKCHLIAIFAISDHEKV